MRLHVSFIIPSSVDGDFGHVQVFAVINVIFDMYKSALIYIPFSTDCAVHFLSIPRNGMTMPWESEISQIKLCKMASAPYSSTSYV